MNIVLYWIIIVLLLFIILPAVAISSVSLIRYFFLKVKRHQNIKISRLISAIVIVVVGLFLIPPLSYYTGESASSELVITGNNARLTYDKYTPEIRYIDLDGIKYQELLTSISNVEYYDYAEETELEYNTPVANIASQDQSIIEKYISAIFKYVPYSQLIYSVEGDDMNDYIYLDEGVLFSKTEIIDEKLTYYRDNSNYNYCVQDYNTDDIYDIDIDSSAIEELNELAYLKNEYEYEDTIESIIDTLPGTVTLELDSDYDLLSIIGESKDKLILHEIGEIYIADDGSMYQLVEEYWQEDGSVALIVLPISKDTTEKLTEQLTSYLL